MERADAEYLSVRETARRWGISDRLVQRYCAQGRIDGARKFGGSWGVPADARKPVDPRRSVAAPASGTHALPERPARTATAHAPVSHASRSRRPAEVCPNLMPLMNTPFEPGHCLEFVESLEDGPRKDVVRAERAYFSGRAEEAAAIAGAHLEDGDLQVRLSSTLIYTFANLSLDGIAQARRAFEWVRATFSGPQGASSSESLTPEVRAMGAFVTQTAAALLHLPEAEGLPDAREVLPLLPAGLRSFALYVHAHRLYLQGEYGQSLGLVLGVFAMQDAVYPIPFIYLHLVAVMDLMSLRRLDEARHHLLAAWDIARPDDLIEGFGEHHGLLGGMLEAAIKPVWPEDFRRIIDITYRFSAGWRRIHNPDAGDDVADNLTTTEFAASMLAARGWTNAEIAEHMGVSPNTVKSYISSSLQKLGVTRRQDLGQFMLS